MYPVYVVRKPIPTITRIPLPNVNTVLCKDDRFIQAYGRSPSVANALGRERIPSDMVSAIITGGS